jgi:hypothetical protein
MANKKTRNARANRTAKSETRRGSPEAIQKRRTARALNTLLTSPASPKVDRRTERRRRRLLAELDRGRRGSELKPIVVLQHADELLKLGTAWADVQKAAGKKYRHPASDDVLQLAVQTQTAYGFDRRAWSLLGIALPKESKSK